MSQKSNIHFDISERKVLLRILDIFCVLALLYGVGLVFDFDYFKINSSHWFWSIVLGLYLTVFATIFELYDLQKASNFEVVVKNIILTSSVTVLFYLLTPFFSPELPENRIQIVYFYLAINVALFLWRYAYISLIATPRFFKRVLLVSDASEVELVASVLHKVDPNYKVIGFINTENKAYKPLEIGGLEEFEGKNIKEAVADHFISEIVVCTPEAQGINRRIYNELLELLESGFPIREYTQVYEELSKRVPVQHVDKDFYRYFPFSRSNQNKLYLFFHRLLDLLFSLIGLIFGLLISPVIIIGNLIGNRGPVFYTQERVGRNGKVFKIIKLRTMVVDAEKDGAQYATAKDVRITRFGNFLRKTRFDEIPQFLNVIKGEMSVIGPRPERPVFVKELSEIIPFYEIRHIVKPGVTGWAQVNAKYGVSHADALEKLQYDLYYIKRRSLFLDISIVIKTLSTIIFYRGQ
ncbi:sugar transferase [Gilvibacter sediminis]|uniref:sugar transferase n=1 Tax=Gilvibacter sediminis TaxID=379071 RepID=UPI0023502F79|nr:sugar transferase [Gilvibacter sediminis]MDC7999244.1 sugar transferase [Gilvibacter sediminis]